LLKVVYWFVLVGSSCEAPISLFRLIVFLG